MSIFPWADEPETTRLVIEADGAVARHAGIDLFLDSAVENVAAIRAYEKAGFKPVGVMRLSERDADGDGWHDSLLMELLAGEE
jgi:ribosomal protein S18 acetylase RimI-like enzyme